MEHAQAIATTILVVLGIAVLVGLIAYIRGKQPWYERYLRGERLGPNDMIFTEHVRTTAIGTLCGLGLIVVNALALAGFSLARLGLLQVAPLLIWIGLNMLLGLGVALGRRRVFVMRKNPNMPLHGD